MNKLLNHHRRSGTLVCLCYTLVFFVFNACEQAQDIVPDGPVIKEGVTLKISGGLAGITQIIAIEETEEGIFLTKQKAPPDSPDEPISTTWELLEEAYTQLWQTMETNEVWNLQSNDEMLDTVADGFTYDVMLRQDAQAHEFSVYAPLTLKELTGDNRYLNIVQAILDLAEEPGEEPDGEPEEPENGDETWKKIEEVDYIRFEESDISSRTERIITIKKLESDITLTDEKHDKDEVVNVKFHQIDQEAYDEFGKTLEENDIWSLKSNNEMGEVVPNASMYVIFLLSQNKMAYGLSVYAPDVLKYKTGEERYLNIVQAILDLANE